MFDSLLLISIGSGDLDLETWPVTKNNLVDDTLAIIVISDGDFIDFRSVLFLVIELLDNSFVIVVILQGGFMVSSTIEVISEGDFLQFCSVLFFCCVRSNIDY